MRAKKKIAALALAAAFCCGGCSGDVIQTAAMNTAMGIGTVFAILVLISILIYCFNIIPYLRSRFAKNQAPMTDPETYMDKRLQEMPVIEEPEEDPFELVAVIAAAVAASSGLDENAFVVRSIRRVK